MKIGAIPVRPGYTAHRAATSQVEPQDTFERMKQELFPIQRPPTPRMRKFPLSAPPSRVDGTWVSAIDGGLVRFNDSSAVSWRVDTPGICKEKPAITPDGKVVVALQKRGSYSPGYKGLKVQAHDLKTGALLWENEQARGPVFSDSKGRLFARGADNRSLLRLDPETGEEVWSSYLGLNALVGRIDEVDPELLMLEARGVFAVDPESGELRYKKMMGAEYARRGDTLVVESGRGQLEICDLKTGEVRKTVDLKPKNMTTSFSVMVVLGRTPGGLNLIWGNPISNAEPMRVCAFDDDGNEIYSLMNMGTNVVADRHQDGTYIVPSPRLPGFEGIDGDTGATRWVWKREEENRFPNLFQTDDGGLYALYSDNSVREIRGQVLGQAMNDGPPAKEAEVEIEHLEDAVVIDGIELPYRD